ncbi:hypothetical protein ACT40Q_13075 [Acinetobacter baumannii]|nr:hypothetical protein [Acinetobacter baumannii]
MTILAEQISAYAEELSKNLDAQTFQNKISDCHVIQEKLYEQINSLNCLATSFHLLKSSISAEEIELLRPDTLVKHFQKAFILLQNVQRIWNSDKKEILRQEKDFGLLLDQLVHCNKEFDSHLNQYWKQYENQLRNQFFIENNLMAGIASIPGQSQLCSEYKEKLRQFDQCVKQIPIKNSQLLVVRELAKNLGILKSKMKFDVPEDVQEFFAQFNTSSTATVSLQELSPEVFLWLHNQKLLGSFMVQRHWNI